MAAKAKIISMSDAREARRRRLSADDRVKAPVRAKAAGEAAPVTGEVEAVETVQAASSVSVASAPTPRVRPQVKASVSAANRVSPEEIAAKRAKAEAKQAAKDARRDKVLSVLPGKLGKKAAAPEPETDGFVEFDTSDATFAAEPEPARRSVRLSARADGRASLAAEADARARAKERAHARKQSIVERRKRLNDRIAAFRARFDEKMQHPKFATATVFVTLLLVVGVFLYPTARTYYQTVREHDRLQAELTAIIQRNAKMAEKIAVLQTDEGIIREAREQLGWVERGENAVLVYGTGIEPEPDVDADIISGSVKAPVTWYSPVLDVIFGVK